MANMFAGYVTKQIPKDLRSCYQTDSVSENLWVWCERIERWGLRLCLLLGLLGIVFIIVDAVEMGQLLDELRLDTDEIQEAAIELGIELRPVYDVVLEGILLWAFYCFVEYCTYHVAALLIGALASIVQHTRITANIALYNAAQAEGIVEEVAEQPVASQPTKPETNYSETLSGITMVDDKDIWICRRCGAKNRQGAICCSTCGNFK
ncbi:MAG: hypothetical protein E7541_05650 [Ruminococcaceae bacterium]|nr:hypothetical protein [Oscillospiraceae bacterium]